MDRTLLYLLLVGGDDANVRNTDGLVQLLGQLAAVEHDLHGLGRVEPGRVVTLPHLGGLERRETHRPSTRGELQKMLFTLLNKHKHTHAHTNPNLLYMYINW